MGDGVCSRIWAYEHVMAHLKTHDDLFMIRGDRLAIFLQRGFLSAAECSELIALIDGDKSPSGVLGESAKDFRTSESSPLGTRGHAVVRRIEARLAEFMGLEPSFGEPMEGIRYDVGSEFKPHNDFFHQDQPYWAEEVGRGGQRTWTAIMPLNEPEGGGCTLFPAAGVRIRPRRGNLVIWCNLGPFGECNPNSLHCGEPVEKGVKYLATKWFREHRFMPPKRQRRRREVMAMAA